MVSRRLFVLALFVLVAAHAGCVDSLRVLTPAETQTADAGTGSPLDGSIATLGAGPVVLYEFDEGAGDRAFDSSTSGALVHLRVNNPTRVTWVSGGLRIDEPTVLESALPPSALIEACRASGELTIEAWVRPAETLVRGTRRIVTLSASAAVRNFTLGQGALFSEPDSDAYVLRVRTSQLEGTRQTQENGLPMLSTGPGFARPELTHVVSVHRADGSEAIFVDGSVAAQGSRLGDFSTWDDRYRIAVGNELDQSGDTRAWTGELHKLAIYARALPEEEIQSLAAEMNLK